MIYNLTVKLVKLDFIFLPYQGKILLKKKKRKFTFFVVKIFTNVISKSKCTTNYNMKYFSICYKQVRSKNVSFQCEYSRKV